MINVTKTYLPPLEEYVGHLERVWRSGQVTNNGPLLKEFEQRLRESLGVRHAFVVANGTLGLQLALRALEVSRRVVTTPFSYVATTDAILWERATPVFVDVRADDGCLDAARVEGAIDGATDAILAVHVYGHPCDVESLAEIARRRGLKLIYDAAHAFGCRLGGRPLAAFGDVSILSFHATKLFHSVEGGAILTDDDAVARRIRLYRAFGHVDEDYFTVGINAKASELHAAMGLCMLPRVPERIAERKRQSEAYDRLLAGLPLGRLRPAGSSLEYNWSYYPVLFADEPRLLAARAALRDAGIGTRRYFHPALNRLPYRAGEACPVAEDLAARVLCLPLSHEVTAEAQDTVAAVLRGCAGR